MTSLVAIVFFTGFVTTAFAAALSRRRSAVNVFIVWTLGASFAAGIAQRDAWPFASWPLVAGIHPPEATHLRLVGVDGGGAEHSIDYRSWEPLGIDELHAWLRGPFASLTGGQKEAAFAWLLGKAEAGRRRALEGRDPSGRPSPLGPLAAPLFLVHPRIWEEASTVPGTPFVALRLYLETWDIEARARGTGSVQRTLVHESPLGGPPDRSSLRTGGRPSFDDGSTAGSRGDPAAVAPGGDGAHRWLPMAPPAPRGGGPSGEGASAS